MAQVVQQDLHCPGCRARFTHQYGADLFCSKECEAGHQVKLDEARAQLATAGFEQHAETPNIFTKGGVAITIDQVIHEGIEETLARHAAALDEALSGTESEAEGDDYAAHT